MKELRDLPRVPFIRALIPFMGAPPSLPNHFPETSPPDTTTLGIRFQHKTGGQGGGGGHKNIQSMASFIKLKTFLCERDC